MWLSCVTGTVQLTLNDTFVALRSCVRPGRTTALVLFSVSQPQNQFNILLQSLSLDRFRGWVTYSFNHVDLLDFFVT